MPSRRRHQGLSLMHSATPSKYPSPHHPQLIPPPSKYPSILTAPEMGCGTGRIPSVARSALASTPGMVAERR